MGEGLIFGGVVEYGTCRISIFFVVPYVQSLLALFELSCDHP